MQMIRLPGRMDRVLNTFYNKGYPKRHPVSCALEVLYIHTYIYIYVRCLSNDIRCSGGLGSQYGYLAAKTIDFRQRIWGT